MTLVGPDLRAEALGDPGQARALMEHIGADNIMRVYETTRVLGRVCGYHYEYRDTGQVLDGTLVERLLDHTPRIAEAFPAPPPKLRRFGWSTQPVWLTDYGRALIAPRSGGDNQITVTYQFEDDGTLHYVESTSLVPARLLLAADLDAFPATGDPEVEAAVQRLRDVLRNPDPLPAADAPQAAACATQGAGR